MSANHLPPITHGQMIDHPTTVSTTSHTSGQPLEPVTPTASLSSLASVAAASSALSPNTATHPTTASATVVVAPLLSSSILRSYLSSSTSLEAASDDSTSRLNAFTKVESHDCVKVEPVKGGVVYHFPQTFVDEYIGSFRQMAQQPFRELGNQLILASDQLQSDWFNAFIAIVHHWMDHVHSDHEFVICLNIQQMQLQLQEELKLTTDEKKLAVGQLIQDWLYVKVFGVKNRKVDLLLAFYKKTRSTYGHVKLIEYFHNCINQFKPPNKNRLIDFHRSLEPLDQQRKLPTPKVLIELYDEILWATRQKFDLRLTAFYEMSSGTAAGASNSDEEVHSTRKRKKLPESNEAVNEEAEVKNLPRADGINAIPMDMDMDEDESSTPITQPLRRPRLDSSDHRGNNQSTHSLPDTDSLMTDVAAASSSLDSSTISMTSITPTPIGRAVVFSATFVPEPDTIVIHLSCLPPRNPPRGSPAELIAFSSYPRRCCYPLNLTVQEMMERYQSKMIKGNLLPDLQWRIWRRIIGSDRNQQTLQSVHTTSPHPTVSSILDRQSALHLFIQQAEMIPLSHLSRTLASFNSRPQVELEWLVEYRMKGQPWQLLDADLADAVGPTNYIKITRNGKEPSRQPQPTTTISSSPMTISVADATSPAATTDLAFSSTGLSQLNGHSSFLPLPILPPNITPTVSVATAPSTTTAASTTRLVPPPPSPSTDRPLLHAPILPPPAALDHMRGVSDTSDSEITSIPSIADADEDANSNATAAAAAASTTLAPNDSALTPSTSNPTSVPPHASLHPLKPEVEAAIQLLHQQLQVLTQGCYSYGKERQEVEWVNSQLKQENQRLVDQLTQLKSSHREELVNQAKKYESTIQQRELHHMNEKMDWECKLNKFKEEKLDLLSDFQNLETCVSKLSSSLTTAQATITNLDSRISTQTSEITKLSQEKQTLVKDSEHLELTLVESSLQIDALQEEKHLQEVEVQKLKSQIAELVSNQTSAYQHPIKSPVSSRQLIQRDLQR